MFVVLLLLYIVPRAELTQTIMGSYWINRFWWQTWYLRESVKYTLTMHVSYWIALKLLRVAGQIPSTNS